jgi:isopropylmalate/homocitrate/citramalate synthase
MAESTTLKCLAAVEQAIDDLGATEERMADITVIRQMGRALVDTICALADELQQVKAQLASHGHNDLNRY